MQHPFASPYGQGAPGFNAAGLNPAMRGLGAAARTAQTLGIEWFDYFKQSCDDLTAAAERLAAARTPAEVFAIQAAYLRTATGRFSDRAAVLAGLYLTLAGDLARPPSPFGSDRTH